jgi:hypothetical protein
MTTAFQLFINGVEKTPPTADTDSAAEWDATWEERIDGVGSASVTVQDRLNSTTEYGRARDILEMRVNGQIVFQGEITRSQLDLPSGRPFRRWKITASDWNMVFDLRLVGTPDGSEWESIDGGATHTPIDANAHGESSDQQTVRNLFDNYVRLDLRAIGGGFVAFGTSTFVGHFIPIRVLMDSSGNSRLRWTHATLRSALDELRGLAGFPLYYWIDPDKEVHWTNLPVPRPGVTLGPRPTHLIPAPAILTDTSPDGSSTVGFRDLTFQYDGTFMPQFTYVVGATDFIYNGNSPIIQGTGFRGGHIGPIRWARTIVVDAQSMTKAQRDAVGIHYEQYRLRARIKGSVVVGGPNEAIDGWRCGQYIRIFDPRLPPTLNGVPFPIQRVSGSLKAGNDFRVYTLEFGDAPMGSFSQKYRSGAQKLPTARLAAKIHRVYMPTTHLRPSTTYVLHSQMVDHSQKPVRQAGVPVSWSLTVKDRTGATVSAGSLTIHRDTTDQHGRTASSLTTGSATDLHYHVRAVTAAQT